LTTWANKAAVAAYTYDFVNYEQQMNDVRPYFTEAGWRSYESSIQGLITRIQENKLFVNGVVTGAPVISNQGELPGHGYTWRIQLPFLVTYQSAEATSKKKFLVKLMIIRIPTNQNPQAIGIDQFIM
jgi:intracellular multiplication protein IcmL